MTLDGKRVLVTGGTGSLGRTLVGRLLAGDLGRPAKVIVFSRDEAKQQEMRARWSRVSTTDDATYGDYRNTLEFRIGDVRDYDAIAAAMAQSDVVFHAAALKQVPQCEYTPSEAIKTNVLGAVNIVTAAQRDAPSVQLAVAISTDKACKPINVMGMTKALQERVFLTANLGQTRTRFVAVRYGNVISSRGSVVPLFLDQIQAGGPVTVTTPEMTRFLVTLDQAVDAVFAVVRTGRPGETYVPKLPAVRVVDLARALIGDRKVEVAFTGIRPGEKIHEVLISEEEVFRTVERDGYYVIRPILPEMREHEEEPARFTEYSSAESSMTSAQLQALLTSAHTAEGAVRGARN